MVFQMRKYYIFFLVLLILLSCNEASSDNSGRNTLDPNVTPVTIGNWYRPAVNVTWQWQLSGTVDTSHDVEIFDIDLFDSSTALIGQLKSDGHKVICYFSAGSFENWRSDADDFPSAVNGNELDGWESEKWLDIRAPSVHDIMKTRLDLAVDKGCDGVEPDNMDGYINNSGFSLTGTDQLAYNRFISNEAHNRDLSVGLKNDLDQIEQLVDYYDFSVNEQCHEYDECDTLTAFIENDKPVLNAEYKDEYVNDTAARTAMCAATDILQFRTLVLPLDLDDSFRHPCF